MKGQHPSPATAMCMPPRPSARPLRPVPQGPGQHGRRTPPPRDRLLLLHERLDTTTRGGRLAFHAFAALAEFLRELIVSGTREGLDAARVRRRVDGRPAVSAPEIIRAARDLLPHPENSIASIAELLGVSPGTLYSHITDLQELRASGRVRNQLSAD